MRHPIPIKLHRRVLPHIDAEQVPQCMILFFEIKVTAIRHASIDAFCNLFFAVAEEEKFEPGGVVALSFFVSPVVLVVGGGSAGAHCWATGWVILVGTVGVVVDDGVMGEVRVIRHVEGNSGVGDGWEKDWEY